MSLQYIGLWLYVLCMCVLILVDMTNVCTICGESDKNDSISGQQWVQRPCMYRILIYVCIPAGTV